MIIKCLISLPKEVLQRGILLISPLQKHQKWCPFKNSFWFPLRELYGRGKILVSHVRGNKGLVLHAAMRCQVRPPAAAQPFQPGFCPIEEGWAFIDFFPSMKWSEVKSEKKKVSWLCKRKPSRKLLPYERRALFRSQTQPRSSLMTFDYFLKTFLGFLTFKKYSRIIQYKSHNTDSLNYNVLINN